MHRLLLDYFVSLEAVPPKQATKILSSPAVDSAILETGSEASDNPPTEVKPVTEFSKENSTTYVKHDNNMKVLSRTTLLIILSLIIIAGCVGLFSLIRTHLIVVWNASATATAIVVTANPDPYPPYNGKLALYDPLSQPLDWYDNTDTSFGGACKFTNGAYHVSQTRTDRFFICASSYSRSYFSNFAFEVQMKIIRGDCGGVIFREGPGGKLYYFRVCQNGYYHLFLYVDYSGTNAKHLRGKFSSAIRTGLNQSNTVAVVANGSTLDIYVNRQKIDSITDSTYSHGQIGIAADNLGDPTEVVYSSARVWTL